MTQLELHALLEEVVDRKSFLAFVRALMRDRQDEVAKEAVSPSNPYSPGANGWENGSIEAFLEAALAWAEDSNGLPAHADWRGFASFLFAGKHYE